VEPAFDTRSEREVLPGVSVSVTMSTGPTKLKGFEELRDIVTRHRRAWTKEHLDTYLRARWEKDLRSAGDAYNRLTAEHGKVPTAKQFASVAAPAAILWFGGNLTGVYSVLRLPSPVKPTASRLMPADAEAFALRTFAALGGRPRDESLPQSPEERQAQREHNSRYESVLGLAHQSLDYVQLQEALGRPPQLKEFGASKFKYRAEALADDVDEAWRIYDNAVQRALEGTTSAAERSVDPRLDASDASKSERVDGSASPAQPGPVAGWYTDPSGEAAWRWWDGERWTEHRG
jgi:hypothetical protein